MRETIGETAEPRRSARVTQRQHTPAHTLQLHAYLSSQAHKRTLFCLALNTAQRPCVSQRTPASKAHSYHLLFHRAQRYSIQSSIPRSTALLSLFQSKQQLYLYIPPSATLRTSDIAPQPIVASGNIAAANSIEAESRISRTKEKQQPAQHTF